MSSDADNRETSPPTPPQPGSTPLVCTPDGERTRIDELNTGVALTAQPPAVKTEQQQPHSGLRRWWRNLNMVLAGMYTGLGCYGTPNKHHSYSQDSRADADKPDSRPL